MRPTVYSGSSMLSSDLGHRVAPLGFASQLEAEATAGPGRWSCVQDRGSVGARSAPARHSFSVPDRKDVQSWSGRRDSNPRPQPWQGPQAVYARASFSIPETAKPLSNKAFCCSQPTLSYPPHTRRFPLSCFPPASPASAPKAGEAETEQVSNDRAGTDYGQDYETHG